MNAAQLLGLLRLSSNDGREDALRLSIELGVQSVDADEGSLLVLDDSTQELVFAMTVGDAQSENTLIGQRVPVGRGLTGLAALTGEVQVGTPSFPSIRQAEHRADSGPRYLIAAPMFAQEKLVGVLTAASFRHGTQFSGKDVQLFGRVAALAGIVVADGQQKQIMKEMQTGQADAKTPIEIMQREVAETLRRLMHNEARTRNLLNLLLQVEQFSEK